MWINFYINKNQIQAETGNAILIKFPKSDWLVWISKKCVRKGTHNANLQVGVIDDKEYELFRNGKGKYNRFEKIDSKQELGKELAALCGGQA